MADETTMAYAVAELFGHEGDRLVDDRGTNLHGLCVVGMENEDHADLCSIAGIGATIRYVFVDGSAITIRYDADAPDGQRWDIGFSDCFCWDSEGHRPDCERKETDR